MSSSEQHDTTKGSKRPWIKPAVTPMGSIGALLEGGGGKLSPAPKDPGEVRKVPAQDPGN